MILNAGLDTWDVPGRGRAALMLRTAVLVVRRMILGSWSGSSTAKVVSETAMVTVCQRCSRPIATFCPQTITMPELEARRCTRTGSSDGLGVVRRGGSHAAG